MVVLIIMVFVALQIKKDHAECLSSPLIYGAQKLEKANGAMFSCRCGLAKPNSPSIIFDSRSSKLEVENIYGENNVPFLNVSLILGWNEQE